MNDTPATFVHVRLDEFVVAAERYHAPALRRRPVVIGGARWGAGRVVAASAEARARGVCPGMPLREAARRCRPAAFLAGDIERQHDLRALAEEQIRLVWPRVAWVAIDEAVVEVAAAGTAATQRAAERVQQHLHDQFGLAVSCGIARTPFAAGVAARLGRPRGLVVVLPGYEVRFLAGVPLDDVEALDGVARQRLSDAGISTLGELAALPPERAAAMFGRGAAALVRLARGEAPTLPPATRVPRRLCRQATAPLSDASLDALVVELATALERRGLTTSTLGLRVEAPDGESRGHAAPLPRPTASVADVAVAARRLLARTAAPLARAARLSLSATGLVEGLEQGELFGAGAGRTPRRAWGAPARLRHALSPRMAG